MKWLWIALAVILLIAATFGYVVYKHDQLLSHQYPELVVKQGAYEMKVIGLRPFYSPDEEIEFRTELHPLESDEPIMIGNFYGISDHRGVIPGIEEPAKAQGLDIFVTEVIQKGQPVVHDFNMRSGVQYLLPQHPELGEKFPVGPYHLDFKYEFMEVAKDDQGLPMIPEYGEDFETIEVHEHFHVEVIDYSNWQDWLFR